MTKKKEIIRLVKRSKKARKELNEQAYNRIMKSAGQHSCPICPPWKGENTVSRKPKYGSKKPKYKNKRK